MATTVDVQLELTEIDCVSVLCGLGVGMTLWQSVSVLFQNRINNLQRNLSQERYARDRVSAEPKPKPKPKPKPNA